VIINGVYHPDGTAAHAPPVSGSLKNLRHALSRAGCGVSSVEVTGVRTYRIGFRTFDDAWRLACRSDDFERVPRLDVQGPVGFAALRVWARSWRNPAAESGVYSVLVRANDVAEVTRELSSPREDWEAFPGFWSSAWAGWSR
jgi:hypothetical protein